MSAHIPKYPTLDRYPTEASVRDWRRDQKWWWHRRLVTRNSRSIITAYKLAAGKEIRWGGYSNHDLYAWPGWETIIGPEPPLEGLQAAWESNHAGAKRSSQRLHGRRLRFHVLARDGFTCRYCGRKAPYVELHVDHVHPRVEGGTDDPENLVTACLDCNLGKGTRVLEAKP